MIKEVRTKMSKIGDYAKDYVSESTKNISDLKEVPTDVELEDDEFEVKDKQTGKTEVVKQKIITLNNEKYRVPNSVFKQLKVILEDNPNLKKFKVKKSGTGMETSYQVIPLV
mgnify:CR=1 FL=1